MIPASGRRGVLRPVACRYRGLAVAALCATFVSACTSPATTTPATSSGDGPISPTVPLTASVATRGDSWATLAMGHLDDPANTFWQLLTRSNGSSTWELATPPGVASNGGLVATTAASGTVTVGFEPSQALRFSPLAQSADQGSRWSPGVLPGGLALAPDSLAASDGHGYLALLRSGGGEVVANPGDLASWSTVTSRRSLAADPASSACGITGLTAVALGADGGEVVGTACAHGPRPGIFESINRAWRSVGPKLSLPAPGPTTVLRLLATPAGVSALVSAGNAGSRTLFALWSADGLKAWTVSAPLPWAAGTISSTGVTATGGLVVATEDGGGRRTASVVGPSGGKWQHLVAPPAGTSAVVAGPNGTFQALIAEQSTLLVDTLDGGSWRRTQSLAVDIQYGSSN